MLMGQHHINFNKTKMLLNLSINILVATNFIVYISTENQWHFSKKNLHKKNYTEALDSGLIRHLHRFQSQ